MSSTGTNTKTFTVADIKKVVACFSADYAMIAESTDLHSDSVVRSTINDIQIFAEARFVEGITLRLKNAYGTVIKGAKYIPNENAYGWTCNRPGNAIWPATPGGSLNITVTLSSAWWALTDTERQAFKSRTGLLGSWPVTSEDTSMSHLNRSAGQRYVSNGYGMQRDNFELW